MQVYNKPNGFTRAANSAPGEYVNADPGVGSGIDADIAGQHTGGICAGITTAWVIGALNGVSEALNPGMFRSYFDNMLKFQGAYVFQYKCEQGISTTSTGMSKFIQPFINGGVTPGVHQIKKESVRQIGSSLFPPGDWVAYTVIPGHAIGWGRVGGTYLIMDPNYGLHSYSNKVDFVLDLNYLYWAYRSCFRLDPSDDKVELFFYAAGNRPRR